MAGVGRVWWVMGAGGVRMRVGKGEEVGLGVRVMGGGGGIRVKKVDGSIVPIYINLSYETKHLILTFSGSIFCLMVTTSGKSPRGFEPYFLRSNLLVRQTILGQFTTVPTARTPVCQVFPQKMSRLRMKIRIQIFHTHPLPKQHTHTHTQKVKISR